MSHGEVDDERLARERGLGFYRLGMRDMVDQPDVLLAGEQPLQLVARAQVHGLHPQVGLEPMERAEEHLADRPSRTPEELYEEVLLSRSG